MQRRMMCPAGPRRSRILAGAAVLMLVVTGCSNRESPAQKRDHAGTGTATMVNGVQQIVVDTGSDLRFHPSTLIVHPGRVRIVLKNQRAGNSGGPPHNLVVTGLPGASIGTIAEGQTAQATFTAGAPGRYNFVCTIHVQQGQTGVLIVKAGSSGS